MPVIIAYGHQLQVIQPVVELAAIFVIDGEKVIRVGCERTAGNESASHQTMNHEPGLFAITY